MSDCWIGMKIIYNKSIWSHSLHIRPLQTALASLCPRSTGHDLLGLSSGLSVHWHARQGQLTPEVGAWGEGREGTVQCCSLQAWPVPSLLWAPVVSTLFSCCPALPGLPECHECTQQRADCAATFMGRRKNSRGIVASVTYTEVNFSSLVFRVL